MNGDMKYVALKTEVFGWRYKVLRLLGKLQIMEGIILWIQDKRRGMFGLPSDPCIEETDTLLGMIVFDIQWHFVYLITVIQNMAWVLLKKIL